ncbi:MFS transporter [Prauserella sp. PE36]|uniref:MFS transporter n=1 Tax=Prauserella sp. PE36 TaxID=1504709 RepID=UPI000D875014|nr:MFS transporter [Prauserella sp. PE36]PXY33509.1 MFS transporter [Prauserella coralliicola]RBM21707.1 MFS transporter [Prauserella sp. PE36]
MTHAPDRPPVDTVSTSAAPVPEPRQIRRAAWASLVGTTIEWYDFLIYAAAAGLVFGQLFFPELATSSAVLASFATIGVSFFARPLGGIIAGHLGDRIGRKAMLVATLILMGASTTAIGLLPGYATIGAAAPILLVVFRFLQGLSAGGEWGGAALLAVEYAPPGRRGFYGSFPQLGASFGLVLANVALLVAAAATTPEQFVAWGWRIPFLGSIVLIAIGFVVRSGVEESPVFQQVRRSNARRRAPLAVLLREHWRALLVAVGLFVGVNLCGYIMIAFIGTYGTTALGMSRRQMLLVGTVGALSWALWTVVGARWSDRLGRRRTYLFGTLAMGAWTFPMFLLLDTGSLGWMLVSVFGLAIGLGLTYGPQAAAYAELFPPEIRYSGSSLAYAIGAVVGGGFAPLVAAWLLERTGTSLSVSVYMLLGCVVTLVAVFGWRERSRAEREAFVSTVAHPGTRADAE